MLYPQRNPLIPKYWSSIPPRIIRYTTDNGFLSRFVYTAKPVRFEIVDTSGNPQHQHQHHLINIKILKASKEVERVKENKLIKMTAGGQVVVELRLMGYNTELDIKDVNEVILD